MRFSCPLLILFGSNTTNKLSSAGSVGGLLFEDTPHCRLGAIKGSGCLAGIVRLRILLSYFNFLLHTVPQACFSWIFIFNLKEFAKNFFIPDTFFQQIVEVHINGVFRPTDVLDFDFNGGQPIVAVMVISSLSTISLGISSMDTANDAIESSFLFFSAGSSQVDLKKFLIVDRDMLLPICQKEK